MPTIHVDIVSAEGEIFSGDAEMVFAPAKMGEVGIAPRHAPLLTDLKPGEVRVQTLGTFQVWGAGHPVDNQSWDSQRAILLLTFLAERHDGSASRTASRTHFAATSS